MTKKHNQQTLSAKPKAPPKLILSYPSDRNGCGAYRTYFPFNYMLSRQDLNYDIPMLTRFNFDMNLIGSARWIRFQRQVTNKQKKTVFHYKKFQKKVNAGGRLSYDIDDLVHGIEPSNIVAYKFYTPSRQRNMLEIFSVCDRVTFSTQFLKDFYEDGYGLDTGMVVPNFLPRYLWGQCGQRDKYNKGENGKPRILWQGSSSHVNKNGDMDFIVPLVLKTLDKWEWVFMGCQPPELMGKVEFHDWKPFLEYPQELDAIDADIAICPITDNEFNMAKSDLKLLEYSAVGLPGIFSSIGNGLGPYDLVPDVCLTKNTPDDWHDRIQELVDDVGLRMSYLEAQQTELNKRWLEDNIDVYCKAFD